MNLRTQADPILECIGVDAGGARARPLPQRLPRSAMLAAALFAAFCTAAAASSAAWAQTSYPSRPIRLIVGFAAGSTSDMAGRTVAELMSRSLGQPIVVENRPGAGGNIAAEAVAKAVPDGYTLLLGTGSLSTSVGLRPDAKFQPVRDLEPIVQLVSTPLALTVSDKAPFKDFAGLLKEAKARPGEINYGSTGVGGTTHLSMELISQRVGIRMNHVPYNGSSQALTGLLSGSTLVQLDSVLSAKQAVATGHVRAMAVSGSQRSPVLPDAPTFVELGWPNLDWRITVAAILAPKGVAPEILELLNRQANQALQTPEVKSRLADQGGLTLVGGTRADYARALDEETRTWVDVVRTAGIKVD
ncbi:MAG: Bug family tripartite tricarboxylate transporter substrate binding protein [Burkholderiaceae bacterium]